MRMVNLQIERTLLKPNMKTPLLPHIKALLFVISFLAFNTLLAHNPDQSYLYFKIYEDRIEGIRSVRYPIT